MIVAEPCEVLLNEGNAFLLVEFSEEPQRTIVLYGFLTVISCEIALVAVFGKFVEDPHFIIHPLQFTAAVILWNLNLQVALDNEV